MRGYTGIDGKLARMLTCSTLTVKVDGACWQRRVPGEPSSCRLTPSNGRRPSCTVSAPIGAVSRRSNEVIQALCGICTYVRFGRLRVGKWSDNRV